MRVLMLSWEYPPHMIGGLGKHVKDLTPALAEAGAEVHVLTPLLGGGAPEERTPEGVTIHRIQTPQMLDVDHVTFVQQTNLTIVQAAHELGAGGYKFDLIHAHDWLAAEAAVRLKHAWRLPMIATVHATERGRGQGYLLDAQSHQINRIEWALTYEAWRVIACSRFMAQQVHSFFETPLDKIDVIANGVSVAPDPFRSSKKRQAFRRRYAADEHLLAFYVGRIVYEKGLHVLVDAWPMVLNALPNARLLIAGAGGYLEALREQAARLGLGEVVIFTGFISDEDRDRLYHVADAAVFPSLYEPFGIVALEAMAARCPVVVSETGGLAEVVDMHETGVKVLPGDPVSLAWGVIHTLRHPEWSEQRAENAFREVQGQYNWATIARATIDVYRHTLDEWEGSDWGTEHEG